MDRSVRDFKEIAHELGNPMKFLKRGPSFHSHFPWSYFDGACLEGVCSCGFIIFLSNQHFFSIKLEADRGTNIRDEMIALWGILAVETGKDLNHNQIASDS